MSLIRVALDVPVERLFDYRCADPAAHIGMRVLVPFGRQKLIGIIVGKPDASEVPENKLKRAIAVFCDDAPLLQPCRSASARVRRRVLPASTGRRRDGDVARRICAACAPANRRRGAYALTAAGPRVDVDTLPPRAKVQRGLLVCCRARRSSIILRYRTAGAATRKALKALR